MPSARWRLEEELRIGVVSGEDPYVFGWVRNVIPAEDGGVWVYDAQAVELRRFAEDGTHLFSVGRQGQGPSEFSGNACARRGVDGEIWVETETVWHRFDRDGELLGTFRTPSTLACGVRAWLDSEHYLVVHFRFARGSGSQTTFFTLLEWKGDDFIVVDTIPPPEVDALRIISFVNSAGQIVGESTIPFVHDAGWRLQEDGSFLVWDGGGDYALRLQTLDGDTVRTVARAWVPVRIESSARREAIDRLNRPGWRAETALDESEVPRVHPPFSTAILTPDGTIWVTRVGDEGETVREIFSPEGEFLGELDVPEAWSGLTIHSVGRDHLWGTIHDEYDVTFVVRARLVRGGS
ncbi:MAG: hypothetical protein RQ745_04345 [Longimicrobiales bacterium]|nr:hypothetical protein [Longimicrobiales bacterium]